MINLQSHEEKGRTFIVFNLNYTIVQCTQKSVSVLNHKSLYDLRDFSKRAPDS